jgi:hypothetical protein
MKNAKELLLEFTGFSFKDPEKAAAMFAKDSAFEMPHKLRKKKPLARELLQNGLKTRPDGDARTA